MIKVTIILPSYNVASYMKQCLESVIKQTLNEIEILCVDAGSDDGTLEIIQEFCDKDDRIRIIKAEVQSYGAQMNYGIREARGEYIGIVETDDYIEERMFEVLYNAAIVENVDIVKAQPYEIYTYEDGSEYVELSREIPNSYFEKVFSPKDEPDVQKWDNNIWNGIYRRKFLVENHIQFRNTKGAAFQDVGFRHQVLNAAEGILYIPYHLYHYRKLRLGSSTWHQQCMQYICGEYQALLNKGNLDKKMLRQFYCRMFQACLFELDKALKYVNYQIDCLPYPEGLDWLADTLRDALLNGKMNIEDFTKPVQDRILHLMLDKQRYVSLLKERRDLLVGWEEELRRKVGRRQLVLFGVGNYGHIILRFQSINRPVVTAITDNGDWQNYLSCEGVKVISPGDAVLSFPNGYYLIANKKNWSSIKKQLICMGIKEEQIGIFDGADKMLVEEMERRLYLFEIPYIQKQ